MGWSRSEHGRGEGSRILVIDDDPGVRETLSALLEALGHTVDAADGLEQGLAHVDRHAYDLVFTDLMMPGATGWDVVAALRVRTPQTPVVLMTGLATAPVVELARQRGVAFVAKPFSFEELEALRDECLGRPSTAAGRAAPDSASRSPATPL